MTQYVYVGESYIVLTIEHVEITQHGQNTTTSRAKVEVAEGMDALDAAERAFVLAKGGQLL